MIGQPETSWLEFKGEPYNIDKDFSSRERECFELAKDVTAMANVAGGVILIGVRTKQDAEQQQDVADELRPVPAGTVDKKQLQQIVWDWVEPKLNLDIRSHPVPSSDGALWSIYVGTQQDRDRPFIIAREFLGEKTSPSRNLFAVYIRVDSQNSPYAPSQIQGWIHAGWRESQEDQGRHSALEELPSPALVPSTDLPDQTLADDVKAIGAAPSASYYYVQAIPERPERLQAFYRGAPDSLHDALLVIPHLRPAGFHLPSGRDQLGVKRTDSGGLRVVWPENESLSALSSGLTTAVVAQEHLTWASDRMAPRGELWINPIALVEFTLEFWRFYVDQIRTRLESSTRTMWRAGMRSLGGELPVHLPSSFARGSDRQRPDNDDFEVVWTSTEANDPGRVAFEVLTEVYARFGFAEQLIPWSEEGRVSEQEILSIQRGETV